MTTEPTLVTITIYSRISSGDFIRFVKALIEVPNMHFQIHTEGEGWIDVNTSKIDMT